MTGGFLRFGLFAPRWVQSAPSDVETENQIEVQPVEAWTVSGRVRCHPRADPDASIPGFAVLSDTTFPTFIYYYPVPFSSICTVDLGIFHL